MDLQPLNSVYIYALIDPESEEIRYIGKSIRPEQRLQNHINEPPTNCHRSHWIQSLKVRGLRPELIIIEEIRGAWPWQESERYWIKRCLAAGMRLTNNTSGGDGVSDLPPETREKMRKTWLGRKHKPESVEKIRRAVRGRKHTEKHRQHMSDIMTGRKIEWVDKVARSLRRLSDRVPEIEGRLADGEKVGVLAKEYGVHRTTMSKIKKGVYFEPYRKH